MHTFSTYYSEEEDRIRLDCLDVEGAKLGIWFTRPLFDRIIPTLTKQVKIEAATTSHAKFEHEIMQFQAKQERLSNAPETPVRLTTETTLFLCKSVPLKKAT